MAEWLDQYNIKWTYEIQGFDLEDGTWYLPDFYLPELDTLIEVKGAIEHIDKPYKLVQFLKQDTQHWPDDGIMFLLGGPVGVFYNIEQCYGLGLRIIKCGKCDKVSIVTEMEGWYCRSCGEHVTDKIGSAPVITKPLRWLFLERD